MLWKLGEISLSPDVIFTIPGINLPVTNTLLCTWISIIVLVAIFFAATRRRELVPRGIQNAVEAIVEFLRGLAEGIVGKKYGKQFFPLAATLFVFILVSNLLDIFPGVETIGTYTPGEAAGGQPVLGFLLFGNTSNELIPWIRPATTDLNLTIAMAVVVVVTCQIYGFMTLGAGEHLNKYLNFKSLIKKHNFEGFIDFFVGIIDIISELSRIASLSLRLFGNVFAGSVVLAVFAFVLPFVANIIFIPFELLVAAIQAFVFSLLTLIYLQLAVTSHEGHGESEAEHEQLEKLEHA
ncbi:MAG TPA: F0F1 ATP synthase subunit A [Ktedonobacteraceae bacterium]|nr:F0F1 ATP synthase subunit A [Ktedonobacteraceae bacterium]